ncbi:hypothetical protein CBQ26_09235 [Deinococcus indicus]|uniref:Uncharacterized protein n=1 Tax=Deinococcus indicus TaxID=223556 RepID=A0A2D0A802_9DEIO|nr:hypothetical protein [Deinococcus indicus]OWL96550.1 hypothetical protein CBQ26_09235 [Deinococcus indicus]
MTGKQFTAYLNDERCVEDETFAAIQFSVASELGEYLHGCYKISRTLANAYAQVALAGVHLLIRVSDEQLVTLSVKDQTTVKLPLRHDVLHPSGLTFKQRLEADAAERDIAEFAAMRRASVGARKRA